MYFEGHCPDKAKHLMHVAREFPSFKRLVNCRELEDFSRCLLGTAFAQSIFDTSALRIDKKSPDPSLSWHQDYPFNMQSQNCITFWIPIQSITAKQGHVHFLPQSNKAIIPVKYFTQRKEKHYETNYFELDVCETKRLEFEENSVALRDTVEPGSVILIHGMTLHRSGINTSGSPRIVAIVRYGDHLDEQLKSRSWYTARSKYPDLFTEIHPDLSRIF